MLTALPYHLQVKNHFQQQTKTWTYFAANQQKAQQLQAFKTELLKNTYQFTQASDPQLFQIVLSIQEKLFLADLPIFIYQSQFSEELNASIAYLGNEAHIVLSGPILKLLSEDELTAVLAHELAHIKLFTISNSELEVADRIITALGNDIHSPMAYLETARLFKLYTEIFCDRGALQVVGSINPVIQSLVKIATGLQQINADSYLQQADEILAAESNPGTQAPTHPDNYIRAKALQWYQEDPALADTKIEQLMEGRFHLDQLDIFKQQQLNNDTNLLLQYFLQPKWIQTTLTLSLAKQYFPAFAIPIALPETTAFTNRVAAYHDSVKEYFTFCIIDFILADTALESIPAGWALSFTEEIGLATYLQTQLKKELKLSEKKWQQYAQQATTAFNEVKENEGAQLFIEG